MLQFTTVGDGRGVNLLVFTSTVQNIKCFIINKRGVVCIVDFTFSLRGDFISAIGHIVKAKCPLCAIN